MAGRGERLKATDFLASARLAKLPLSAFIALTTLFGAIIASGKPSLGLLPVVIGVFFATSGGASLNSLQELALDRTMRRTSRRPLPTGQMVPAHALWQGAILIGAGLVVLAFVGDGLLLVALTVTAVLLYNGFYTPLKQRTILALIPGLGSGALPPYIGWVGGGGDPLAFPALLLMALLVLWQVPHFHLILLANQEDYRRSPLPHLLRSLSEEGLWRLFIPWVGALACAMMMFAILPQPIPALFRAAVIVNALLLLAVFLCIGGFGRERRYRFLFLILNLFLAMHMGVVAVGRIVAVSV